MDFDKSLIDFDLIDTDGNGVIDEDEWRTACKNVSPDSLCHFDAAG